jgi:hypothetical protein
MRDVSGVKSHHQGMSAHSEGYGKTFLNKLYFPIALLISLSPGQTKDPTDITRAFVGRRERARKSAKDDYCIPQITYTIQAIASYLKHIGHAEDALKVEVQNKTSVNISPLARLGIPLVLPPV